MRLKNNTKLRTLRIKSKLIGPYKKSVYVCVCVCVTFMLVCEYMHVFLVSFFHRKAHLFVNHALSPLAMTGWNGYYKTQSKILISESRSFALFNHMCFRRYRFGLSRNL